MERRDFFKCLGSVALGGMMEGGSAVETVTSLDEPEGQTP